MEYDEKFLQYHFGDNVAGFFFFLNDYTFFNKWRFFKVYIFGIQEDNPNRLHNAINAVLVILGIFLEYNQS